MNYYIQDFCCICLSISKEKCSTDSSKYPDNLSPYDKIKTVFLELSAVMDSDSRVCLKCSEVIDSIYKFNRTCLKNIKIFNSYKKVLKENQSKKLCDVFVNLNESRQFKENTLTLDKIKIEPPESLVTNDDMLCDTNFILQCHSNAAVEVKKEIEMNCKTFDAESETSWLDPPTKIKIETTDVEEEQINEMNAIPEDETVISNNKDFEFIPIQSTEEVFIKEEPNRELIHDPLPETVGKKSYNQGHSEYIVENQSKSFLEKPFHEDNNGSDLTMSCKLNLDSHLLSHSKGQTHPERKSHECDVCGKLFNRIGCLKKHMLVHTGEKPHICDICGKLFTQRSGLMTHKLIHIGGKSYSCEICEKSFTRKENLKTHISHIHKGDKPHKCDVCGKLFNQKQHLKSHMVIHIGEKSYKCEFCEKLFNRKENLKSHISHIHKGDKSHECESCGKLFISKQHLKSHMLIHGEKSYKCHICETSFYHSGSLKTHMLIHAGDNPHKCDICGKSFTQSGSLKLHILTHTGEKPHKCDVCGKLCNRKENLKLHMLIHTGEKPYKCDICEKSFNQHGNLKTHMLSHTGEKPHKCDICGKLFNRKQQLQSHILIHTGEKPFKCEICGKSCNRKENLKIHMQTHIKQESF